MACYHHLLYPSHLLSATEEHSKSWVSSTPFTFLLKPTIHHTLAIQIRGRDVYENIFGAVLRCDSSSSNYSQLSVTNLVWDKQLYETDLKESNGGDET